MISNNDPNNDFPDMDKLLNNFLLFVSIVVIAIGTLIYYIF